MLSSALILGPMRQVPTKVLPIMKYHTEDQPHRACRGPMTSRPTALMALPVPLIRPVTVPSDLELPRTVGWDARSAATADVMMLLGPPQGCPCRRA